MSQIVQTKRPRFGVLQIGILLLTLITASAHLYLASQPSEELRFWFLLNGLGYLTLLTAFFLPQLARVHHLVRWVLLGYTLLTIVLWFFLGSPKEGWPWDPFDIAVKLDELALVILLFLEESRQNTSRRV